MLKNNNYNNEDVIYIIYFIFYIFSLYLEVNLDLLQFNKSVI